MNLETMNHLELFKNLGFPVLLGTSRKSMIGLALDLPVDQRVEGTLATSVIGVMKGCSFAVSYTHLMTSTSKIKFLLY